MPIQCQNADKTHCDKFVYTGTHQVLASTQELLQIGCSIITLPTWLQHFWYIFNLSMTAKSKWHQKCTAAKWLLYSKKWLSLLMPDYEGIAAYKRQIALAMVYQIYVQLSSHSTLSTCADHLKGPWRWVGSFQPDGASSFDMTAWQDEDGTGYLVRSVGNSFLGVSRLSDNFASTEGICTFTIQVSIKQTWPSNNNICIVYALSFRENVSEMQERFDCHCNARSLVSAKLSNEQCLQTLHTFICRRRWLSRLHVWVINDTSIIWTLIDVLKLL